MLVTLNMVHVIIMLFVRISMSDISRMVKINNLQLEGFLILPDLVTSIQPDKISHIL